MLILFWIALVGYLLILAWNYVVEVEKDKEDLRLKYETELRLLKKESETK